jgi:integrase
MAPKLRQTNKHLPRRVYWKHGAFYLVTAENKWIRLGKSEAEMYASLSRLQNQDTSLEPSMSALFARYLAEVVPTKAPRTQNDNQKELNNLEKSFGKLDPKKIKPIHVYQYLDARGKTARTRANREIALLSHVFSYAIRWGICEHNPCREVRKLSEKPRDRYVEDWEYAAVYAIAPTIIKAAMEVAVITGMRQGDILALKRTDCTSEGLSVVQSKTRKKQIFQWTPGLRSALDQAIAIDRSISSIWIFATTTGRRYSSSGFQTAWHRLMDKAIADGLLTNRFTFHDLRAKAGSEHEDATRLLGHQNPATTRRVYIRKPDKVKPNR